jgi:predicted DNA-binding transcriptional regulator AlpA
MSISNPSGTSNNDVLSAAEVGSWLGRHPATIKRWARARLIPGRQLVEGGEWEFERTEIQEWLDRKTVRAEDAA